MPTVSVIIPAYNSAASILEALASVFAQTVPCYEVIVINDGSADTEKLEAALAQFKNRVVYMKHENRGAAAARNSGLRIARGEWIAFLDADDRWQPAYLEEQLELLKRSEADVVYADADILGDPKLAGATFMGLAPSRCEVTPESLLAVDVGVLTSGVVTRRDLIQQVGLFDESIRRGHDFDLWLRLAQRKAKFVCNKKVLLSYTVLGKGLSGDAINQLQRRLELLSSIQARGGLSASEETALKTNFEENTARLALEQGKAKLLEEDFAGAMNFFKHSRSLQNNRKLALIGFCLRIAPRTFMRLYRAHFAAMSLTLTQLP
jgi:glycosyltransferase involved in cell wall biosynthesis